MGLAVARAQGRLGGRPPAMSGAQIKQAKRMRSGGMSLADIREVLGVSRSTLYRHLK
ncbi:helix-turn-helix domain-containing protein [Rhodococcus sp. NPDC077669]